MDENTTFDDFYTRSGNGSVSEEETDVKDLATYHLLYKIGKLFSSNRNVPLGFIVPCCRNDLHS